MVTRAKQINSAYSKAKAKSPQAVIKKRINKKLSSSTKSKTKPKPMKPKSVSAIKKRADKMFDSF